MIMLFVMVVMVVCMIPFAGFMARDKKTPSGDSVAIAPLKTAGGQLDRERVECLLKDLFGYAKIAQCRHGHVTADSGKSIDVKGFHESKMGEEQRRAIIP